MTNEVAIEIEEEEIEEGNEQYIENNMNELVNRENPSSNNISRAESTRKSKEKYSECNICGKTLNVKSLVRHKRNLHNA